MAGPETYSGNGYTAVIVGPEKSASGVAPLLAYIAHVQHGRIPDPVRQCTGVWTVLTLLLHKAISVLALFLIGLALRNLFKMK